MSRSRVISCPAETDLKPTATWEDIWGELPEDVRLALQPRAGAESTQGESASLFGESELGPQERKILRVLKSDEALHLDQIIERLEPTISSSEIFAPLFELELAGRVKQLPGKTSWKVSSSQLAVLTSQSSLTGGLERFTLCNLLRLPIRASFKTRNHPRGSFGKGFSYC